MSHTTFNAIPGGILFPAVHSVFTTNRQAVFDETQEQNELHFLGDGRCDSPGYKAKYGTYTVINSKSSYILDFHISHVYLAVNSERMELDCLKHVSGRIEQNDNKVTSLATDRHNQDRKYMKKIWNTSVMYCIWAKI